MCRYEGRWSGKIFFDGKEYIDFSQSKHCILKAEEFPLPSDSMFRSDIQSLKAGNIQSSQACK